MATAREIIRRSLRLCEAIGAGDTVDGDAKETNAFGYLNDLLTYWGAEKLLVPYLTTETFSLIVGTSVYTIGSSGNFNTVRPNRIINAFIRDSSNNDYPVDIISLEEYDACTLKTTSARPDRLVYLPENPLGKIKLYPTPSAVESLIIDSWKPLAQIALVSDSFGLPPEYLRAITYNLAVEIAPEYGIVKNELIRQAETAKKAIKSLNVGVIPIAGFDSALGGAGHSYNVYTDQRRSM